MVHNQLSFGKSNIRKLSPLKIIENFNTKQLEATKKKVYYFLIENQYFQKVYIPLPKIQYC